MNFETVFALMILLAGLLIADIVFCRRGIKNASVPQEARPWRYLSRALRLIAIVVIFAIVATQMDIPNPFAPTSTESSPAFGFSRDVDDKLTVPATNADPAKAAEDNRKLLEEARRQQN